MQHLRLEADVGVEDILRQLERHPHRITIVVVRNVVAPVDDIRHRLPGMRDAPAFHVHDAITSVHLDNGRDQRDQMIANIPDVRALVDREAIGQLHQSRGGASFGGVNGASDVVHGCDFVGDLCRGRIVHVEQARVGQFRQFRFVLVQLCD